MPRRRPVLPEDSEPNAIVEKIMGYVMTSLGRIKGEALSLSNRIGAGPPTRNIGEGGGGLSPVDSFDRLDEIRAGLQKIVEGKDIS